MGANCNKHILGDVFSKIQSPLGVPYALHLISIGLFINTTLSPTRDSKVYTVENHFVLLMRL